MRARAPGKLLLSGAYAVLEGATAVVCAVDRYAWASGRSGTAPAEVRAALADPPLVDTHALEGKGGKLGLGSSAAGLVAALGLRAAEAGEDVAAAAVRDRIFARARAAHGEVQHGGSGVDVAASVYGGVLRYRAHGDGHCERASLPVNIRFAAFFSGQSARTSELRARVDALRARDSAAYRRAMATLVELAERAEAAIVRSNSLPHTRVNVSDRSLTPSGVTKRVASLRRAARAAGPSSESNGDQASELLTVLQQSSRALAALGAAADAPIVPPAFGALATLAEQEGAAFFPSGAGGGDVGLFVGTDAPSASFVKRAGQLGMTPLELAIDLEGVTVFSAT